MAVFLRIGCSVKIQVQQGDEDMHLSRNVFVVSTPGGLDRRKRDREDFKSLCLGDGSVQISVRHSLMGRSITHPPKNKRRMSSNQSNSLWPETMTKNIWFQGRSDRNQESLL